MPEVAGAGDDGIDVVKVGVDSVLRLKIVRPETPCVEIAKMVHARFPALRIYSLDMISDYVCEARG